MALRLENPRETLSDLTRDSDLKVRIAAWKGLMRLDSEESKNAVKSTDTAVRKIAVDTLFESGMVSEEVIDELMSDPALQSVMQSRRTSQIEISTTRSRGHTTVVWM